MRVTLLQLNTYWGRYIEKLIEFVTKQDFDILHLQEVAGGRLTPLGTDCFTYIKDRLSDYNGVLNTNFKIAGDNLTYLGNATFCKNTFSITSEKIIWLKDYEEHRYVEDSQEIDWKNAPRSALSLLLEKEGVKMQCINTHLAWGSNPKDEDYKINQAEKLYRYVKSLKVPFVLTGDFNVSADSVIVSWFNEISRNLIVEHNVHSTLNASVHRAKELFPQGLAVDYIFTHPSINVKRFRVIDEVDLSDHLGLLLEFEI